MSTMTQKQMVRARFKTAVFDRDRARCVVCNMKAHDAHHIIPRTEIAGGGYVVENGVSLCFACHRCAEYYCEATGQPAGYSPANLFHLIGSSERQARETAERVAGVNAFLLGE